MQRNEGRPPRPFIPRTAIALAILGPLVAASVLVFSPELSLRIADAIAYERFYSRTEPDGRRIILERKSRSWLPGPEMRCVVIESDGVRAVHDVAECAETVSPEQRIQAALLGEDE
jgi:hypothetical protein